MLAGETRLARAVGAFEEGEGMVVSLVVGLGNPGPEYASTRHNVGFRVADELSSRLGVSGWTERSFSHVAVVRRSREIVVAKPMTYMNRSGLAVASLAKELGVEPVEILVVSDDVDLPLGRLRLRARGGPGTHNGLRDIVEAIGTDFPRLRLGVRGDDPWHDLADYVTNPFPSDEEPQVAEMVARAADAAETVLFVGLKRAMDRFNRRAQAEEQPPPEAQ